MYAHTSVNFRPLDQPRLPSSCLLVQTLCLSPSSLFISRALPIFSLCMHTVGHTHEVLASIQKKGSNARRSQSIADAKSGIEKEDPIQDGRLL